MFQTRTPQSLRHFYGIIMEAGELNLRKDNPLIMSMTYHQHERDSELDEDELIDGVDIPGTPYTLLVDLDGRNIITDLSQAVDFRNEDLSDNNDTAVSTIQIPSMTDQLQFNTFSDKYDLPRAAIHNLVLYHC